MSRTAARVDPASHAAGLRRGIMFLTCAAGLCAALVAGAESRPAAAGAGSLAVKTGRP